MIRVLLISLIIILLSVSCSEGGKNKNGHDLPQILQNDTLRVITLNSSTSYFIYRDQPMGYHYDMITEFSRQHNLTPKITVAENSNSMMKLLKNREVDVIAYDMPVTNEMRDSILYCGLQQITHQVLVQRAQHIDFMITDVANLIGKKVTVVKGSRFHDRIINLNNELGGGIIIEEIRGDTVLVEDLVRMVSRGEIEYTVADDDLAKFNQTYFNNIDVHLPISFDQRSSWVVRMDSPILADSLNSWFKKSISQPAYLRIIKRYFEVAKGYSDVHLPTFKSNLGEGVISPYDVYFRQYGEAVGIDWRLLAAVSYQESTFNSEGTSWAGAKGLMGLMPSTAASLGVDSDMLIDPEANIRAGAEYLQKLIVFFNSVENKDEQLKLALASYNGGIGHISDARALAEKYGADKDVWDGSVEKFIQLKRLEQYYNDPVCKNGYFRGDETISYVSDVLGWWLHFKEKIKE
ncbi:MAG TPA: transglycosylase SLT domain-containing protein [Bacteroidales bacterium]|nr:transglycosylase SLT domain-containing protein [Bacteroidales bacterium]